MSSIMYLVRCEQLCDSCVKDALTHANEGWALITERVVKIDKWHQIKESLNRVLQNIELRPTPLQLWLRLIYIT